jgi:hypothetical protein
MNSEPITLRMTKDEADKLGFILMTALHKTTMLDSERAVGMIAVNSLFTQLRYELRTDKHGNRTQEK